MTGGQDAVGAVGVPDIVKMVLLEGVSKVIVTTDDLDRYDADEFPDGVDVWHRTRLDEAQKVLAAVPGTTVLLHDQACAAENRRARSRGKLATPDFRVVINERVCEGCGDCGAKSNCLSVQPIDTPYGRKTVIDQTSCNFDFSCLEGDCPAFATVSTDPARQRRTGTSTGEVDVTDLPEPTPIVDRSRFTVRLSGIGGTGVVTVSQILGTAAMLAGHTVRGLDQTGLSQKAGPVTSDIRITDGLSAASNHVSVSGVDALLAFDLLAAAGDSHRKGATPDRTVVIANTHAVPTGAIVTNPATQFPAIESLQGRMDQVSRSGLNRYLDAAAITTGLFGGTTTINIFMLGVAAQVGAVPVGTEFLERAIELNGVAVEGNIAAFRWGRRWAVDPAGVEAAAGLVAPPPESLDELIDRLADDLVGFQSRRYADRYRAGVDRVRAAERAIDPGSTALTDAVVRNLHKLMAYKDEYEVARLLLLDESRARYETIGGKRTKVTYRLHPPMLRAMGMKHKLKLRRTGAPLMRSLRSAKGLRGTLFDPFRWGEVRATERAMIPEYEHAVDRLIEGLTAANLEHAVSIAGLPDQVRGYEHLKLARAKTYRAELATRLAEFTNS
jgi:indolepyruvate ferredoxin oxidoreductase